MGWGSAGSGASKQREALGDGSATLSTPVAAPPARPGAPNLAESGVLRLSLHAQGCSLAGRARNAEAPRPGVATASPRTSSLGLHRPRLICVAKGGNVETETKVPKSKASSAPKQYDAQVTGEPLTCFPLWCLRLFSPPLHKPFRRREDKTGCKAPRETSSGCVDPAAPPVLPTRAREEDVGSARPVPARSLSLGITGFCRD
jgi:hypothetical protein